MNTTVNAIIVTVDAYSSINFENLTLRDLRHILPQTSGVDTPSEQWIREHAKEAMCMINLEDTQILVFPNGFYTYERDGRVSILRVDGFTHIHYSFADGSGMDVEESEYLDCSFATALELNGENQWERNSDKRHGYAHGFSIGDTPDEWREEFRTPSPEDQMIEKEDEMEEHQRLQKALRTLTERQKQIVKMYFYQNMTQAEISKVTGVCQQRVSRVIDQAVLKLRKNF